MNDLLSTGGFVQLPSVCAACAPRGSHFRIPRQALLSPHGDHEQTRLQSHQTAFPRPAGVGVCLVQTTNSSHCHRLDGIRCHGEQSEAMVAHA